MLALTVLAGCTSGAPPAPAPPMETAVPSGSPAGGPDTDLDVDALDPCAPFRSTLWLKAAVVDPGMDPQAAPEPAGGCRWRGPGLTATVAVESGRSLLDYSTDPAYQPGERGRDGNPYWRTATSDATRVCHAFLAAGPARPDTVVHVTTGTEAAEAPLTGGGDAHACVFASVLVSATSSVLQQ